MLSYFGFRIMYIYTCHIYKVYNPHGEDDAGHISAEHTANYSHKVLLYSLPPSIEEQLRYGTVVGNLT